MSNPKSQNHLTPGAAIYNPVGNQFKKEWTSGSPAPRGGAGGTEASSSAIKSAAEAGGPGAFPGATDIGGAAASAMGTGAMGLAAHDMKKAIKDYGKNTGYSHQKPGSSAQKSWTEDPAFGGSGK